MAATAKPAKQSVDDLIAAFDREHPANEAPPKKSLDDLMGEWGARVTISVTDSAPEAPPPAATGSHRVRPRSECADEARATVLDGIREAEPELARVSDALLADLIGGEIRRDPTIAKAWRGRAKDSARWGEVVEELAKTLLARLPDHEKAKPANRRLAARAAGRTTVTVAFDPRKEADEKALQMSPSEFAEHIFKTTNIRI